MIGQTRGKKTHKKLAAPDRHDYNIKCSNGIGVTRAPETVYLITDNRDLLANTVKTIPGLSHWPMVAAWWKERIKYVGPYGEHTTVVFVPITSDACALLLGLCCFLLLSLLPPGPLFFVLLLLASAHCLPPRSCSFFGLLCPLRCLCVFWCVVCCPFLVWPLCCVCWLCSCLVLLVCSSRIVVGLVGCACCQLTKVPKDSRGLPVPNITHTPGTVISSLSSHLEVDLSLNSFVDFLVVLAVHVCLAL